MSHPARSYRLPQEHTAPASDTARRAPHVQFKCMGAGTPIG